MQFLQASLSLSHLGTNILLSTLFSNTHQTAFSHQ
jgi:hypothetical protein